MLDFGINDIKIILKDFGEVSFYFSFIFLLPLLFILIFFEPVSNVLFFLAPFLICIASGYILKSAFKDYHGTKEIHAFVVITLVWFVLGFVGGIPYLMSTQTTAMNSYFESISSLTTTGISVISTELPNSIIFWRALQGWIGGAGIVVLALVGILKYTKRTKLFQAEYGEEKIKPTIVSTIKSIWWVYSLLTLIGAAVLMITGIDWFSSLTSSMNLVSATGMDKAILNRLNFNFIQNAAILFITVLGGISLSVHFAFFTRNRLAYLRDTQTKVLFGIFTAASILIIPRFIELYGALGIEYGIFHVISASIGGGYQMLGADAWDALTKSIFCALMVIGGSAYSPAGGIKVIRFWIFIKSIFWKIKEFTLPKKAYFKKQISGKNILDEDISYTAVFILLYLLFVIVGAFVLMYTYNTSLEDSFFEVSSMQAGIGFTTGIVNPNMPLHVQLTLITNMIVGRLEILPILAAIGFLLKLRVKK